MKRLPQKLFATWEDVDTDAWLRAATNVNELSEKEESVTVGVYKLIETKVAINKTELVSK